MRSLTLVVLLGTLCPAGAQRPEPRVAALPAALDAKTEILNPKFLVFDPRPAPEADTKVPLLIYLHGAGGFGDKLEKIGGQASQVVKGIAQFKKGRIVVAPQCLRPPKQGGAGWQPAELDVLLGHLKATLPVDEKRIYLTGNSMGGYGSWAWGGNSPQHFAAIAPVVGGIGPGGPKDVTPALEKWAANLAKVPVYAFAGAKDKVVPAERSERMVAAIKKAGGTKAKIKVFPDEGHGAGRVVWSTREVYDWMFAQARE